MRALLAIDTTGEYCTAALRRPGRDDVIHAERIGRGHAERLAPMVEALLGEAGQDAGALERIGVTTGPGSFAGTRVGIAFARGLALATGASPVGISNLAVIARMADLPATGRIAVLHDAKRGEIVVQMFDKGKAGAPPERLSLEAAAQWLKPLIVSGVRPAGRGAAAVLAQIELARWTDDIFTDGPDIDPRVLLDLAERSDAPPSPFYARPPDAKLPGGKTPA